MFMKLDSSSQNLDSLIEQYNRELMRFYQQNAPRIQPDGEPVEEPEGPVRVAYPAKIISPPNPPDFQEDNRREMRERLEQESAAPVPHPSQSNASTPAQPLPQGGPARFQKLSHPSGGPDSGGRAAARRTAGRGARGARKTDARGKQRADATTDFHAAGPGIFPGRKAPPSCRKSCPFPCLQDTYRCFYPPQGRPRRFRAPS